MLSAGAPLEPMHTPNETTMEHKRNRTGSRKLETGISASFSGVTSSVSPIKVSRATHYALVK